VLDSAAEQPTMDTAPPDLPRFARGILAMDLRQWWLDHRTRLIPNGTTWAALRARYWSRVKKISLDAWKRSAKAREWTSKHPNLVIAPVVIAGVLFLLRSGQDAAAATVVGAWFRAV
jgi:hypothetical protein